MLRLVLIVASLLVIIGAGAYTLVPAGSVVAPTGNNQAQNPSKDDLIFVTSLREGDTVHSPLVVRGEARGNWFFEASFPVTLTDWDGKIIAQVPAQAKGEWMTTDYVPFEATLEFENPSWSEAFSKRGALILQKDNPSGLPEHDNALEITVFFE